MNPTLYDRYAPPLSIILIVGATMLFGWWVAQLVDKPAKPVDTISHSP